MFSSISSYPLKLFVHRAVPSQPTRVQSALPNSSARTPSSAHEPSEPSFSERTMYRITAQAGENRERRNIRTYPDLVKPELLATRPNELWSWDITTSRAAEMDLLLPIRHPGRLKPLRRRLDGRSSRNQGARAQVHCRNAGDGARAEGRTAPRDVLRSAIVSNQSPSSRSHQRVLESSTARRATELLAEVGRFLTGVG